jgi:MFS family permease
MISALIIPNYADRKGRKNVVFTTSSAAILISLGLIFSRSFEFTCFVIFVLGLLVSGNFSVSFVYNMEFFPPEWQSTIGTFDNIILTVLWGVEPLYFLYVSKNYVWLMAIGASANAVAICGFIFFLEESPLYLYNRKENEKADKIVAKILRINNMFKK